MTQASVSSTRGAAAGPATDLSGRARLVEEAVHSVRMEGLDVSEEAAADAAAYAEGRIDVDELGRRIRARYGVPEVTPPGAGRRGR